MDGAKACDSVGFLVKDNHGVLQGSKKGPRGVPRAQNHGFWALLGPRDPDSCENGAGGAPASIPLDIASNGGTATCFRPDLMFFGIFFFWKFWPETGLGVPASASTPEQATGGPSGQIWMIWDDSW